MKRILLSSMAFVMLTTLVVYTVSSCGGRGVVNPNPDPQLNVTQISGADSIMENGTGVYSVSAAGVGGITYAWTLSPSTAGTLQNSNTSSVTFTADEVNENITVTLRVVVSRFGVPSVTRTKTVNVTGVFVGGAPVIHSVSPVSGTHGENVSFTAYVDGTTPCTYAWNFGGGATPNISSQISPFVTLANTGLYNGTLTVTNSMGQDTIHFTITITNTAKRPELTDVLMSSMYERDYCVFSVMGTGAEPLAISWNFGGGAYPNTSNEVMPEVVLQWAGIYYGSVTASNSSGSDTLTFSYKVFESHSDLFELLDGNGVIYAQDGTYLGLISSSWFISDSIMNEFGTYGSQFSETSIFNEFGHYGSDYSYLSPWNDFASSPPLILIGNVFVAYLTTNSWMTPAIDPRELITYLAAN